MCSIGRCKRGQGSIIGAAFVVMILFTGFMLYSFQLESMNNYAGIFQDMLELDNKKSTEQLEFLSVSFTILGLLNITIMNAGPNQIHLIWLGIFNEYNNTQDYYSIDHYVNSLETEHDIRNDTIPSFEGKERVIQLVTELGNTFSHSYPETSVTDSNEDRYIWVDETCDLHPPSAMGTHGFFSAQQYGPDGICDTLTEINTASIVNITLIDNESFEDTWPPPGWSEDPGSSRWNKESDQAYNGSFSADFDGWGWGRSGNLDSPDLNCSGTDVIYIEFWYRDEGCEVDEFLLQYYNGTSWNTITDLGSTASEYQWLSYREKIIDSQYLKWNFKIRWSAVDVEGGEQINVDSVTVKKEGEGVSYKLDLEVKWVGVDYDESNEWLCIYGGDMGAEDLLVDVWNGSDWITVFNDLEDGWKNVDISSYLVSSTFVIRFSGGTETGDSSQDTWEIDATFLHVWTEGG